MNLVLAAQIVCICLVTGGMVGLLGIGAGVLMVPALMLVTHMPLKSAVAITLAMQTIPVGVFGAITYYRDGHMDMWHVLCAAVGMSIGVAVGAYLSSLNSVSDVSLQRALGGIVICLGAFTIHSTFSAA